MAASNNATSDAPPRLLPLGMAACDAAAVEVVAAAAPAAPDIIAPLLGLGNTLLRDLMPSTRTARALALDT